MTDDPVDYMELGETKRLGNSTELHLHDVAWDEFVGSDREIDNVDLKTSVDGRELTIEVTADVTKVDPATKPVFQSEDRFENGWNHSKRAWWRDYVTGGIATMIAGVVTLGVGVKGTEAAFPGVDMHPLLITAGEVAPVAMLVMIGMAVVGLLTIGPRRVSP